MFAWWQKLCGFLRRATHAEHSEGREKKILPDGRCVVIILDGHRRRMHVAGDRLVDKIGEVLIQDIPDGTIILSPGGWAFVSLYGEPDQGNGSPRNRPPSRSTSRIRQGDGQASGSISTPNEGSQPGSSPTSTQDSSNCVPVAVIAPLVIDALTGSQDSN